MSTSAPRRHLRGGLAPTTRTSKAPWWRAGAPAAAAVMTVLLLTSPWHGFHGDELYFRMLTPAWWYDDQPPLTVWLAHAAANVSHAVWVQRLPAVLAAGAGAVVAAAFPRMLGHDIRVQRIAAWAHAFTVYPLLVGHVMLTASLDLLAWQLVLLCVVAALTGRPHAWTWAGFVAGIACWNKLLVLVLVGAILLALVVGARSVLRTRDVWRGAIVLVVIGGFQVGAQLVHGLPMLEVSADLVARHGGLNRLLVVPLLVVFLGPPFAVIAGRGVQAAMRGNAARSSRAIRVVTIAALVTLLSTLVSPAQPYYAVAAFLPLVAMGWGFAAERRDPMWRRAPVVIGTNAVIAALVCLPVVPVSSPAFPVVAAIDPVQRDQSDWPTLARQIAAATPSGADVVTDSYALAGAAHRFGPDAGLTSRRVASWHNALWSLGPPRTDTVLVVGGAQASNRPRFARCIDAGRLHAPQDPFGLDGTPMLRCSGPRGGWNAVWPSLRRLGG